jgi:enoyl-CoA hydratase/carnithine racemase
MEMLLTGEPIDARTALAWGLVNRVVAADALDEAIAHFTGLIKARGAATIRLGKEAFYAQVEQPIAAAYAVTSEAMVQHAARRCV